MKGFDIKVQHIFIPFIIVWLYIFHASEADDSMAPMEKNEQEALYSAIQGFVGNEWNGSDLYPDPCGWTPIQGVSCDFFNGFWHVTDINIGSIYDNSLSCSPNAEFRHHLFELKHLRKLSFSNCFLSLHKKQVTIPISEWGRLSNTLESLEFRSNPGLIGAIPTTLGQLKNLQSLVLLENGLTGELPQNIGDLIHLKRLVLSGNQFVGQIPMNLGKLSELLIFDASRNSLSGPLPLTIGGLTSLIKLDLSNNFLQGRLPQELGDVKSLTLLDLSFNNFSGGLTKSLQELVSLQEMVLSNNPMGGNLMEIQWRSLQNLEYLDLSDMVLSGSIPDSMTEMKKLRYLGLKNNNLSGIIPSSGFENMPGLNALYLDGNNFTGRLEFSEQFYGKFGSRFRASDNLNLCFSFELMSSRHVPVGVKPCVQESNIPG